MKAASESFFLLSENKMREVKFSLRRPFEFLCVFSRMDGQYLSLIAIFLLSQWVTFKLAIEWEQEKNRI